MSRVIMIQGTMSSAGKSFLAAGLCRIFKEDGLSVAPFKSQNMALNSYITEEGLEMGRAQVMQAEAAGIRPEAAMNPVLLKPTSHMGSQVIVNGEVLGNYSAAEYFKMKKSLIPEIKRAYDSLAERFDVIVVEGAGSPAEINLRSKTTLSTWAWRSSSTLRCCWRETLTGAVYSPSFTARRPCCPTGSGPGSVPLSLINSGEIRRS